MTKYELADNLGVSHQAVYQWYNGKKMPSTKNISKMSKLLKIPIAEVFALFESYKKNPIKKKVKEYSHELPTRKSRV